jgi:predicted amidohydrolase YtcJ
MAQPLFLRNGIVLTPEPVPAGVAVLLRDGRIDAVRAERDLVPLARDCRAVDLDLRGRTLIPAFIDPHLHLLAYAARLVSVDCGPAAAPSIAAIQALVRARATTLPAGAWVRAAGYDELALAERRRPSRRDLDAAAPDHPVRLLHRSGHACVLNSRALALAGIDGSTPEPPGGYMERDLTTGQPTGLLLEMDDLVEAAVPPLEPAELRAAVREAGARLLRYGVTFVEDASPANGPDEWRLFEGLLTDGSLPVGVSMMEGIGHLGALPETGAAGSLRRGPVKVMPRELEHEFHPPQAELTAILRRIEGSGRKAAVHAVSRNGIDTVLAAFDPLGPQARGHRIEHCGVCSPRQARRMAALGLTVVTQPGFISTNGDLLSQRVAPADLPDLYPLRRLLEAGVALAGSSDAPVIDPDPLAGLRGALMRRTPSGVPLSPGQTLSGAQALALFTSAAARALGLEGRRGRIAPTLAADLAVLNQDPTAPTADWPSLHVDTTIRAGEVAFQR